MKNYIQHHTQQNLIIGGLSWLALLILSLNQWSYLAQIHLLILFGIAILTPMSLRLVIPIYQDDTGAYRIGNTRVLLELVIHAFLNGDTPESIVDSYETLKTGDVYAVIAYYLTNRDEIDQYMIERDKEIDAIIGEINKNRTVEGQQFRTRLLRHREKSRGL